MQNKKVYIVLIVIFLVFFCIMFFTYAIPNIEKEKEELVLIVDNDSAWERKSNQWINLDSTARTSLNWQNFTVYLNQKKSGNYYLWYDEKWYAFNENKEAVNLEGSLLAYQSNYEISILNFQEQEINSDAYIQKVLSSHNLSTKSKLTSSYKASVDFDQDGQIEEFYVISNAFSTDFQASTIFSFAFMVKNNSIYMIFEEIGTDYYSACKPYFHTFINIDKEMPYEVILNCGGYSLESQKTNLYQFQKNKFQRLISN